MPETPAELNHLFMFYAIKYLDNQRRSYQAINDVLGALEGVKLEFYRRMAVPYEDARIIERRLEKLNG